MQSVWRKNVRWGLKYLLDVARRRWDSLRLNVRPYSLFPSQRYTIQSWDPARTCKTGLLHNRVTEGEVEVCMWKGVTQGCNYNSVVAFNSDLLTWILFLHTQSLTQRDLCGKSQISSAPLTILTYMSCCDCQHVPGNISILSLNKSLRWKSSYYRMAT